MLRLPRIAVVAPLLLAVTALGVPVPLFSNGSANPADHGLATGAISRSGMAAPAGAQWSELQSAANVSNALAGASMQLGGTPGAYRLADDFVVSGTTLGWNVSSISVFAYVSGGNAAFSAMNARIWNGPPNALGSQVVWESAGSGASLTTAPLALYRIFNSVTLPVSLPTTSRQVHKLRLTTPGLLLTPRRYWLDWQVNLADSAVTAFSPTVIVVGERNPVGANALQYKPLAGMPRWAGLVDLGKPTSAADAPQDLPFLIEGNLAVPHCAGDVNGSGDVNFADVSAVLTLWGWVYPSGTGAGDADGNGVVEFRDVTAVLINWGVACD